MKSSILSSLTLTVAALLSPVQEVAAQQYLPYGPRCGLLRSDVRVSRNGFTGTSTFERTNFKINPESNRQQEIDLTRAMRLNRQDCENFVISKVRLWSFRLSKKTETAVALTLSNRGMNEFVIDNINIPHSPSRTPKKQLFKVEELLGQPLRLMNNFDTLKLHFMGDGDVRIDRIEVEWELAPLHFNYLPGFDYISAPIIDDAPIYVDSQTGNVIVVNGNNNTVVIGNNNVVGNGNTVINNNR